MNAFFIDGKIRQSDAIGSVQTVYYPVEDRDSSLVGLFYLETDTMRMFMTPERKMEKIWASKSDGVLYPMTQIPPGQDFLQNFGWYEYIRPTDKDDIYFIPEKHTRKTSSPAPTHGSAKALVRRTRPTP